MEFRDAVRQRRMCRNFAATPIDPATVDGLLDLARRAPSAGHTQGWEFLVLDEPATTDRFWSATFPAGVPDDFPWPGLFHAPVIVIPFADAAAYRARYAEPDKLGHPPGDDFWPVPFWVVDTGFATMSLLLAAVDAGLGALFFGIFPEHLAAVRAAFAVPDRLAPIGAVALGVPAPADRPSTSRARGRRGLPDVVHRGHF